MKKLITLLLMFAGVFAMNAQDDSDWYCNAPEKYQPANTTIIVTRTSPCNQGEEAFMDFIPKFRTDKAFRNQRIKVDPEDYISNSLAEGLDNDTWSKVKAGKKVNKREGWKSMGTWYDITADKVCFVLSIEPINLIDEWGGSGYWFRFQRINGKWYLTAAQVAE